MSTIEIFFLTALQNQLFCLCRLPAVQLIKSEIDLNNQTFANKSKSLWDKVNGVLEEVKAVKTSVV
jgi:hypothetical protein